jgi:hypothetical protein
MSTLGHSQKSALKLGMSAIRVCAQELVKYPGDLPNGEIELLWNIVKIPCGRQICGDFETRIRAAYENGSHNGMKASRRYSLGSAVPFRRPNRTFG